MNEYKTYQATKVIVSQKKRKHEEAAQHSTDISNPTGTGTDHDAKKAKVYSQVPMDSALNSGSASHTSSKPKVASQKAFEDQLVRMLIEDMQPLSTVERHGFRKFCSLLLPGYAVPSRRSTSRWLHELYAVEKEDMFKTLADIHWLSATADIWSAHKRAYMGLTLHYVDPTTLAMASSTLACRRFKGSHTGIEIGKMLYSIFKEFKITSKIQNVVTDNASNFAKAFTLYHRDNADATVSTDDNIGDSPNSEEDEESFTALNIITVNDELENFAVEHDEPDEAVDEDPDPIVLPPHKRCGNHSLNLVACSDALKARTEKVYRRSYDRVMAKIQALWNAVSRSPKNNDVIEEIANKSFVQPTCTRWCSEYYAVERIVDIGLEKVVDCQGVLGLSKMTEADMKFLKSYLTVMKPVVTAMKILESETDCYLSHMIPTIMGIERKLKCNSDLTMKPLTDALLNGLESRFGEIKTSYEYRMASCLHPKFKLAFLPTDDRVHYKHLLMSYVQDVNRKVQVLTATPAIASLSSTKKRNEDPLSSDPDTDDDDLYSFLHTPQTSFDTAISEQVCCNIILCNV